MQPFSSTAIDERPIYVVFNGFATSMVGDHALQAKVGERIRIVVGNGGPNLVSSFHVMAGDLRPGSTSNGAGMFRRTCTLRWYPPAALRS